MAADETTWIEFPLGITRVTNKSQFNLLPAEVRELTDIDIERSPGSLLLRRGHEKVFGSIRDAVRIRKVIVHKHVGEVYYLYALVDRIVIDETNGREIHGQVYRRLLDDENDTWHQVSGDEQTYWRTWPHLGYFVDGELLGPEDFDLISTGDEIRSYGKTLGWYGRVSLRPDQESMGRIFLESDHNLGHLLPANRYISAPNYISNAPLDLVSFDWFDEDIANGYGYAENRWIYVAASIVYEGGQESPLRLVFFDDIPNDATERIRLYLTINNVAAWPFRAKAIRIYGTDLGYSVSDPLFAADFYLLREVETYRSIDQKDGEYNTSVQAVTFPCSVYQEGDNLIGFRARYAEDISYFNAADGTRYGRRGPREPSAWDGDLWCEAGDSRMRITEVRAFSEGDPPSPVALFVVDEIHQHLLAPLVRNRPFPVKFYMRWADVDTDVSDPNLKARILIYLRGSKGATRRYFDNTRVGQKVKDVSPQRFRAYNKGDRMFFWRVTDEDGKHHRDRLYFSHHNGNPGVHCPDIVPPANFLGPSDEHR